MDFLFSNDTNSQVKERLINCFAVHQKPLNNIFQEIRSSKGEKPEQNYLVMGQRGAGKTIFLYRLKFAIEDDHRLNKFIITIMFGEEQYHITNLFELWESVAEQLKGSKAFSGIIKTIQSDKLSNKYIEQKAYQLLESTLKKRDKKIVLFIENIDIIFDKIGKTGQQRLREVLTTSTNIRIIGSATTYFEGIIDYSYPFYDFFKIIRLNELSTEDAVTLLTKMAAQSKEPIKRTQMLTQNATRIEVLRRLTGGNPRMIAYLYPILMDNVSGSPIEDLYKLLDRFTLLNKSELDQLSPQQQKIIDFMARNWDAISVKQLVSGTRMASKHISSVLNMLEKIKVIDRINTNTKNNLYRIRDRVLNIWYLMRYGKAKDKENLRWLVRFYVAWCGKSGLLEEYYNNDNDNALALPRQAVDKDKYEAYNRMARYLLKVRNTKSVESDVLKEGFEHKNKEFANIPRHHHYERQHFDETVEMFIKTFDLDEKNAMLFLADYTILGGVEEWKEATMRLIETKLAPFAEPLVAVEYAKILIWNDRYEASYGILSKSAAGISSILNGDHENHKLKLLIELTCYFIILIAKKQFNMVKLLFDWEQLNFKQIIKPVYYAFMRYIKDEYPNKYLKSGPELEQTIVEIISEIERLKTLL